MNEADLALLRARCEAIAARNVMLWAADLLAGALPERQGQQDTAQMFMIKQKFEHNRNDLSLLTFQELNAAESDLTAAEVQDATDRLVAEFLERLGKLGR